MSESTLWQRLRLRSQSLTPSTVHSGYPNYRADIDGLRAIAVLSVVAFHAFPSSVRGGFVGVDVFFVISGYLISSIIFKNLERGTFSPLAFYARRMRRIFPALIVVLAACFVYGWFQLLPQEFKQLGKHMVAGAAFVSNIVLWRDSNYFDNAAETKPLLHLWSLGIEEQFYIFWPLLLGLAWKRRINLMGFTVGLLMVSFVLNIVGVRQHPTAAFYLPQTRFWELLAGCSLAYFTLRPIQVPTEASNRFKRWYTEALQAGWPQDHSAIRNWFSIIGIFLLVGAMFGTDGSDSFPGWWAVAPVAGTFVVIAAGPAAWVNRAVLSNKALVWVGLISFPIYLWHWPLLTFARLATGDLAPLRVRIGLVILSVLLAWLTYVLVEKPFRFGAHGRSKATALACAMLVIAAVGGYTSAHNGFPTRFPSIVGDLLQFKYDTIANPWRSETCFLNIEQDESTFSTCPQPAADKRETLLLWGDSYAASMYPGFAATFSSQYVIVQRTASACPPIIGLVVPLRPHCADINNFILAYVQTQKPDRVVLAADWARGDSWTGVSSTIQLLKAAGIKHIELVGPLPYWRESLAKQLYLAFESSTPHVVPYRMTFGLDPRFESVDVAMAAFAREQGIEYVSPAQILCNQSGCLTRLGDQVDSLTASDYGHLTSSGARYLVARFPKQ